MSTPISISRIVKTFGKGTGTVRAVDDVSLEVDPGELFFLLGPSGCGKTTLLRMIAGFEEPTRGTIRFGDRDVTHLPANRRHTGMVFQSYALWPHMTVAANVAFGLGVRKVRGADRDSRVREALRAVRMEEYATRKPNQLSGGQQQRVALARAIVIRPDVLLLDEPLSNLDAKLRGELRSEIRQVCKQSGITTLYVTHDQKEALSMADRIGVLNAGKLEQAGTPEELYRQPRNRFVAEFLGESNFIEGRVVESSAGRALIETDVGRLTAATSATPGADVIVSIRPEAFRMSQSEVRNSINVLRGMQVHTTYSGDMARHLVQHAGGRTLAVSELNPRSGGPGDSRQIFLSVEPSQVCVLPPCDQRHAE